MALIMRYFGQDKLHIGINGIYTTNRYTVTHIYN